MPRKKVLVFASGGKTGGGSGFLEMVEFSRTCPPVLDADIVGVVSNHERGGVRQKANSLGVHFEYWPGPFDATSYRLYVEHFGADFAMCSGWLKLIRGLPASRTVNIHPGPLPLTAGLYGHYVHEAVIAAFKRGEITQSEVTMHFVDEEWDHGPIIFRIPVFIRNDDDAETLAKRVNEKERAWQSYIFNQVVQGNIFLIDGLVRRINGAENLPH